jgi:hypothetical protein
MATTAVHAVTCQIQNSALRMMPLDVYAHLPVQLVEYFRTDQLVRQIPARLDVIPEAVRRHVPAAVIGLGQPPDDRASCGNSLNLVWASSTVISFSQPYQHRNHRRGPL